MARHKRSSPPTKDKARSSDTPARNRGADQPLTEQDWVLLHTYGQALQHVAETGYKHHGRGSVVADLRGPGDIVPIVYSAMTLPLPREEWQYMVKTYIPHRQLVVVTVTDDGVTAQLFTVPPKAEA